MTGPYAQAAGDYWSAGWHGPLPLPARKKTYPPRGYTGADGRDPSFPDVMAWTEGAEGEGNIALRMPADVVGLDIDSYGEKRGAETLSSGERTYGELPATWRTTSRDDGVSGIRLYRVPAGLRWPGSFGPGTEIVRRGHRYAVAPPSIHPEGRTYRWITPDGLTSTAGPRPEDLPDLPDGWLVGLTGGELDNPTPKADVTDDEVTAWIAAHDRPDTCPALAAAVQRTIDGFTAGSAHEALSRLVGLLRLAADGHRGLSDGLDAIRAAFLAETTRAGRSGRRDESEAAKEWARSVGGAVAKVVGDPRGGESERDPCDGPTKLNREHRADAYAARGDVHDRTWLDAQLRDDVRELGKAVGTDALDLAEAVGFLGQHATTLELVDPDRFDVAISTAIARARVNPETAEAALLRGRDRAMARPWTLAGESQAETLHEPEDMPVTTVEDSEQVADEGPTPEQLYELKVLAEVAEQRRRRDALRRLQAEDAAPLRLLGLREFLSAPRPEPVVPGVFYRDSLSRIFGAPGCGKSFLAIDLACHVALGRPWRDEDVTQGPVVYVMAEGQAVNVQRTEAWCERNKVDPDDLEGHLFAVPDAVQLTDEGVRELAAAVGELRPVMIILDTKNAMMVGEENSATDTATMRRALDALRKASGACVVLIDHTGYEGTRARGSSAATAAMDTELRVTKGDGSPALITAEVTRDKAAETGREWRWHLRMAADAAALVPTEDEDEDAIDGDLEWTETAATIPTELLHFEGAGARAMPDLARYMAAEASAKDGDPAEVGASRADAERALKVRGHAKSTVRRAWSALIDLGHIEPAQGVKALTGRHVWHP